MKTPDQLLVDVERRLARTWPAVVTARAVVGDLAEYRSGDTASGEAVEVAWPFAFPLGQPTSAALETNFSTYAAQVGHWRQWAVDHAVELRTRERRVHGTLQQLPTHLHVPDLDTGARLCGGPWPARLSRGQARAAVLADRYPHLVQPARVIAAIDSYTDVDFDLLCGAADWFARHDATGMTPRQVPIEGLHAKWLNTRQALVRELAGVEDLRLLPPHPARVHFTYLDPTYRATGARLHDSATVGDRVTLPYRPQVVVISENKDTAIGFPELPGGIAVEGVGKGGATAAAFGWIRDAPEVFYWGDMDADGLEILEGFRAAGIPAVSILMGTAAYETWRRFGVDVDPRGRPLDSRDPRPVPHLTEDEAALYRWVISPTCAGPRRIEQERIPLAEALAALAALDAVRRHATPNIDGHSVPSVRG